jgi:hypothetical protein
MREYAATAAGTAVAGPAEWAMPSTEAIVALTDRRAAAFGDPGH